MTIPYKLFERLIADLIEFRANPNDKTDDQLLKTEEFVNWPYSASSEQLLDWEAACNRTRAEFEDKVNNLKALGTNL